MDKENRLKLAILLSSIFMIVEIVGGYLANSIAIFSDAAHLLTDIAGFGIALIAAIAAKSPGTKKLTFGLARAEVFGALGSVLSLWVITAFLLYAAFFRAKDWLEGHPEKVDGFLMFAVACFGVLVNLCLGYVFSQEHGGAFHPGHSHEHGHDCHGGGGHDDHHGHSHAHQNQSYQKVSTFEIESGSCHGHDHGHASNDDHGDCGGHDHGHGHAHGHGHDHHADESTSLVQVKAVPTATYGVHDHGSCDHGDDHGHSHGHEKKHHNDDHAVEPHNNHSHDVNLEAAYLHVLTDLIQSIGVALAGLVMYFQPDWQIIDPICTFVFSFVALYSTVPLLKKVFVILLEGAPSHVDWEVVMKELTSIHGVEDVHDLHIWSISSKSISLTCHIRTKNPQETLKAAHKICRRMGIDHATIQVHDAKDPHFCYSQTCDWEHDTITSEEILVNGNNTKERNNLCVSHRV